MPASPVAMRRRTRAARWGARRRARLGAAPAQAVVRAGIHSMRPARGAPFAQRRVSVHVASRAWRVRVKNVPSRGVSARRPRRAGPRSTKLPKTSRSDLPGISARMIAMSSSAIEFRRILQGGVVRIPAVESRILPLMLSRVLKHQQFGMMATALRTSRARRQARTPRRFLRRAARRRPAGSPRRGCESGSATADARAASRFRCSGLFRSSQASNTAPRYACSS